MKVAPTTDRGRETLERILDAACELFYLHGVRATGLDQIAKASRTGKGQIYHFFTGKPDLVLSVVNRQVSRVLGAQQPLLDQISSPEDLRSWAHLLIHLHEQDDDPVRCPLGALVAEMAEDDPTVHAALEAGFVRWRTALAAGLTRIAATGAIADDIDPEAGAEILLAAYQGGALLSQVHGGPGTLRLSIEHAVRNVLSPAGRMTSSR